MKKFLKIFFAFIVLLVVFISFTPQIFHEKIEAIALKEIRSKLKAKVDFAHFDLSIWQNFPNFTISLENLSVADTTIKNDTLLKSIQIDCVVDAMEYITDGHINVMSVTFTEPIVNAWISKKGETNFSILKNDTTTDVNDTTELTIHIQKIELVNANIYYSDLKNKNNISLKGFNFNGKGEIGPDAFELEAALTVDTSSLILGDKKYFKNKKIEFDGLLGINSKENKYSIKRSEVKINQFRFNTDGDVDLQPNRYGINFKINSPDCELKEILSLASFFQSDMDAIETDGKVNFSGFSNGYYVPGTDTIPKFEFKLEVADCSFKMDTLPDVIQNIHLDFVASNSKGLLDSTELKMDTLFFQLHEHTIFGHAHIHGLRNMELDGSLKGSIHIDEILKVYPIKGLDADGEITFDIEADGKYDSIGSGMNLPNVAFDIAIKNGMFKYDSLPESLTKINFSSKGRNTQGKMEEAELSIDQLSFIMGHDPVQGKLKLKGFTNPMIDGNFSADIHLQDIKEVYPIEGLDMNGAFKIVANLHGIYNKTTGEFPKVNAQLQVKNGYVKTESYAKPMEKVNLLVDFKNVTGKIEDTQMIIKELNYFIEGDPFEASGSIDDFKNFAYDLKIKGVVDVGKITKIYPIEDMALSGVVKMDVAVKGTITDLQNGKYQKTMANGTIELNDLFVSANLLPKSIEIKKGFFTLSPETINLKSMQMHCGKSVFSVDGKLNDYFCFFYNDGDLVEANLNLKADTLDLNEWKEMFISSSSKADETATSSIWQVPTTIDFDFDSDLKYVKYEDMELKDLKGEIRIKGGVLSLTKVGFDMLGAKFHIAGNYDTRDMKHPLFDFETDVQNLDIQKAYNGIKLIRDLASAANEAEGVFSINYKIKGELDKNMNPLIPTVIGGGELKIASAKINGMKIFDELGKATKKKEMSDPHLKNFTLNTEIRNNKLFVKPFSVKVSGFHTEIEGVNDLSGPISYLIKVELLPIEKMKIPFNVSGTYDNPKVALGKGERLPDEISGKTETAPN